MSDRMDILRFVALLERHGAALDRWPAADAAAARAFLDGSTAARAELALSRQLEQVLANEAIPVPSAALRARVLAAAPGAAAHVADAAPPPAVALSARHGRTAALHELWRALGGARIAGPALAAALVLGVSLGVTAPVRVDEPGTDEDDVELVDLVQLTSEYPDY